MKKLFQMKKKCRLTGNYQTKLMKLKMIEQG